MKDNDSPKKFLIPHSGICQYPLVQGGIWKATGVRHFPKSTHGPSASFRRGR